MSENAFPAPDSGSEEFEKEVRAKAGEVHKLLGELEILLSTHGANAEGDSKKLAHLLALMDELFNPDTGTCEIDPWYERMIMLLADMLQRFHQSQPDDEEIMALLTGLGYDENLVAAIVTVLGTDLSGLLDDEDDDEELEEAMTAAKELFNVPGLE